MTTIFEPTKLSYQLANLEDWCVVVVGDLKGPRNYSMAGVRKQVVYLDPGTQSQLPYEIIGHLPWNHFSRKNVGYTYAIHHGASIIYDTDDDNVLATDSIPLDQILGSAIRQKLPHAFQKIYNPYIDFGSQGMSNKAIFSWPRGLPLEVIQDPYSCLTLDDATFVSSSSIGVVQSLANHEPDVDSIFRLTKELPLYFSASETARALPAGMITPFNAQATLFMHSSLWALLLPATVHGRVSDIWRSYIAQRLMWDVGQVVIVSPPFVKQYRNAHNYMADFNAEQDLFSKAGELVKFLFQWKPQSSRFAGRLEELVIALYERGFLGEKDVLLQQAWLKDLINIGYILPTYNKTSNFEPQIIDFDKTVSQGVQTTEAKFKSGRVAVCVSGQPRTLDMEVSDKVYPKSWAPMTCGTSNPVAEGPVYRTIQERLFNTLEKKHGFDVFMYVSTTEQGKRWPRVGDETVCSKLKPRNSSNHLLCSVEKEERRPWNASILSNYSYNDDYGINGLYQQLYGMYKCNEMRKKYTAETGVHYDYIIRLRPDTSFLDTFPDLEHFDFGNGVDESKIFVADKNLCCCGNEDWFGVGHAHIMDRYLDRILYLPFHALDNWKLGSWWGAETYLLNFLQTYGPVELVDDPSIKACIVKPLDRHIYGDP